MNGNAPHTWVTCLDTDSSLMTSKSKTLEVVLCVFTQVWVSAFRCTHTLTCPFTTHTHSCSHTIYSRARTPGDAHFPCFCLGGAAMVWNNPVFGRGQTLARPEGGRHSIPPSPGEAMVWDLF